MIQKQKLPHTDPPCAACAELDRRRKLVRGRIGTLLMRFGQRLGGDIIRANAEGTWT